MAVKALIFDSGIGGFSVFGHIRQALPGLESYYLMDNQVFPYGIQQDDFLIERIVKLCQKACEQYDIQLLIIACNTASTLALPALREVLKIPVIGVVPAIKTAANLSQSKHIALLATPATIDRQYTDNLIAEHAEQCTVTRIGSSELVKLAEDYWFSGECQHDQLKVILAPHLPPQVDQLVLGCTHFPILAHEIQQLFPHINLVDSGEAIARRTCYILQQLGYSLEQFSQPSDQHQLLVSAQVQDSAKFLAACQTIAPYQSFHII
jgi:glutamate racemase